MILLPVGNAEVLDDRYSKTTTCRCLARAIATDSVIHTYGQAILPLAGVTRRGTANYSAQAMSECVPQSKV